MGRVQATSSAIFPWTTVNASFFRGQLFKIEVAFSRNQPEMLEALRGLFGPSSPERYPDPRLRTLRAECWFGEKTFCAIVAPRNSELRTGWDAVVMYDLALNRAAKRYAAEEPSRAAQALGEDGFGEFRFGITLKEFSRKLRHLPAVSETGIGQKEAVIPGPEDTKLGPYPLSSLRASFFQDKLYRIDLDFDATRRKYTRGSRAASRRRRMTIPGAEAARVSGQNNLPGEGWLRLSSLPAPTVRHGIPLPLYDRQMDERRREFQQEAPRRAAKDL